MRHFLSLTLLCLCAMMAVAQELTLKEFRLDPSDTYAAAFPVKDANGDNCGMIRLGLVVPEAQFDGDIISSQYKDGEWLIYMINGANWINIKTPTYIPLRIEFKDHDVQSIKSNNTYVMTVEKPQDADIPKGTLRIECRNNQGLIIETADVYVDGEKVSGVIPKKEDYVKCTDGSHEIEIRANGYNYESKTVNVVLNKTQDISFVLFPKGTINIDGVSYEMIKVKGGTFRMGAEKMLTKKPGNLNVAKPHEVTLGSYSIGATEVSNALWIKVMGSCPSLQKDNDLPVTNVSYEDVMMFIKRLNKRLGTSFRLPSEAEWEYAARARGSNDGTSIPKMAVYNSGGKAKNRATAKVYECGENPLKIRGMQGNVAEWCYDWFGLYPTVGTEVPTGPESGRHRVVRGGSYLSTEDYDLYGTTRSHMNPNETASSVGFRLALDD